MAEFSPDVVEKSSEAVVEQPLLESPLPWVLRHAVFLSHEYPTGVQGVPDAREIAKAVQGIGVLPGGLRLRQFRGGTPPALTRPRRVGPAHEAKRIPVPVDTDQLR